MFVPRRGERSSLLEISRSDLNKTVYDEEEGKFLSSPIYSPPPPSLGSTYNRCSSTCDSGIVISLSAGIPGDDFEESSSSSSGSEKPKRHEKPLKLVREECDLH